MKNINLKLFALKYKLLQILTKSLEADKKAIKEGANITFKDYCEIKIIECSRSTYSKEDQMKLDEYAKANDIHKIETKYIRIDIDKIPIEVDEKVNNLLQTLEDNANDKNIKKVASKLIDKK